LFGAADDAIVFAEGRGPLEMWVGAAVMPTNLYEDRGKADGGSFAAGEKSVIDP